MAEVISKTNAIPPSIWYHNRHEKGQFFAVNCSISVGKGSKLDGSSSSKSDFHGIRFTVDQNSARWAPKMRNPQFFDPQMSLTIGKAQKWWEKGVQSNMKEITSAQDLVDSLLNAGDKLVVVDFFSPGCGGCKALHPKICQLAEMNPDVQFLQINYEEHKSMCYSLNVHVLPFFRFYRGAEGRLCSFSCTNATIKKFKDALAKHKPDRCSLGPTKGLDEKELLALASNKDLSFTYTPKPVEAEPVPLQQQESASDFKLPYAPTKLYSSKETEEKSLVSSGR